MDTADGPDTPSSYIRLKRGKGPDYFTSCLPWPQKGDAVNPDVVYLTHFRSTREKLRQHFTHAVLLSSISDAEGVDLSHMKDVVIVNVGYSGAKFTQLRERIVNLNRVSEAHIHHIVTDAGVSRDVYDSVSAKKNFNLRAFQQCRKTFGSN